MVLYSIRSIVPGLVLELLLLSCYNNILFSVRRETGRNMNDTWQHDRFSGPPGSSGGKVLIVYVVKGRGAQVVLDFVHRGHIL